MFEQTYKLTFFDRKSGKTVSVNHTTTDLSFTGIKKAASEYDADFNTLEVSNPVVVSNPKFRG